MQKLEFKRITLALRDLSAVQRKIVVTELAALDAQPEAILVIEGRFAAAAQCPRCAGHCVIRHGHAKGLQRYLCRSCRRTFSALTGTPLSGIHKRGQWIHQVKALQEGLTLHEVAQALSIHVSTAHRWRHRFLALPKHIQAQGLCGIVEADETVFLRSFKGKRVELGRTARHRGGKAEKRGMSAEQVPVLVIRDRSGATVDCVLTALDAPTLAAALRPVLSKDVALCTDGSLALAAAARDIGIEHHAVNLSAGVRVDGAWHVQNVNAYHSRLKGWIRKFRGVATRHLPSYLGWFRALDRQPLDSWKPSQWLAMALGSMA